MTYQKWHADYQDLLATLPLKWAFSEEQADKMCEDFGITREEAPDKLGCLLGGFYLLSDSEKIKQIFDTAEKKQNELHELMESDEEFAVNAFYYEMSNYEYCYDYFEGDYNVCSCFGKCEYDDNKSYMDYLMEMGYGEEVMNAFKKARRKYYKDGEENGWF